MAGYIVVQGNRAVCIGNYPDGPKGGLLLYGTKAYEFSTLEKAQRAIDRTNTYSNEHGLKWHEFGPYSIYRLSKRREC